MNKVDLDKSVARATNPTLPPPETAERARIIEQDERLLAVILCEHKVHLSAISNTFGDDRRGEGNPVPKLRKLSNDQIREIRARHLKGEQSSVLAAEFGVAKSTVNRIMSGKHWKGLK